MEGCLFMRIVHTSDWHLGKTMSDYSLLEDQIYFLNHFAEEMRQQRPDVIIIAGDFYDRSVPAAQVVEVANQILDTLVGSLKIPVIITAGNHDSKERLSFAYKMMEKSGLYLVGSNYQPIPKITLYDDNGAVHFYPLPYMNRYDIKSVYPQQHFSKEEDAFLFWTQQLREQLNPNERNVLIAHGFFSLSGNLEKSDGTQVGGSQLVSLAEFSNFDYIALGHIHKARTVGLPQARYSGSPLKYSVSESSHKKVYYLVELTEKGNLNIQEHVIKPLRDVRIVSGVFADIKRREYHENQNFDDYVFISLHDREPVPDVMSRLKPLFSNILGIQFPEYGSSIFQNQETLKSLQNKSISDLFYDFYRLSTGEPLTPIQEKIIQEMTAQFE